MNILIKLTCLVGLVIAPILGGHTSETAVATQEVETIMQAEGKTSERTIEVTMNKEDQLATATVTIKTSDNGKTKKEVKKLKGSEQEIKAEIEKIKASLK